jgi:hypothetical protein
MFHVPDVRKTVDWYRDIGFTVLNTYDDGGDGLSFAMLSFGAGEVMFSSGGRISPHHRRDADLYVYTQDVDGLYDRVKDRVEIVEGPHNMFYGMREVIVRDLNGFWITFGEEIPADVLTPWPPVDAALLQPYAGRYRSGAGVAVLITIHNGRLLAFPDESPGVYLKPESELAFTAVMSEPAKVMFDRGAAAMSALTFEMNGRAMTFARV